MPSDTTKALILLLALLHAKSLPGVYTLRSLSYFIKARNLTEPAIGLLEASKYHSRVWFDDLDLNIHLNNSSYNKMMDFARIQLCTLLFPGWQHRHKFDMCLAQTVLFFKAEVPRFSKYTITSRIFAWDDKWIWMQHRFSIKRKTRPLCCIAYSRMVAKHPKGKTIVPVKLFEKMGHKEAYPGEWEQYRQLGMSLIEGMMKIGDPTADLPPASRRLVNPTRARI
ncbi:MAG: hypothetical protein JOS17DRAFT_680383 [Linnemannia elongata]|nr:MAG: hypothetical protein JOS17DRAFT_680383 [Linnemannia elongata]